MFTGIVEELGIIRKLHVSGHSGSIEIEAHKVLRNTNVAADGRFGGHIVSGHVDGTGTILSMKKEENAVWVTISAPPSIMKFIVEKGSVCLDGISLTVAAVGESDFKVSVIPHTGGETTLLKKKAGNTINIENDIIGKYVDRLLNFKDSSPSDGGGITMDFLRKYDF